MTFGRRWQPLASELRRLASGLAYAGLALLGVFSAYAVWLTAGPPLSFEQALLLGPPVMVGIGFLIDWFRRHGSVSPASAAAFLATLLGAIVILIGVEVEPWFSGYAFFVAPPALALASFFLVAAIERPKEPVSDAALAFVLGSSAAVLLPLAFLAGYDFPRDVLGPALVLLEVLLAATWSVRFLLSRRDVPRG
jgi:hypothetical protein